jgi:hypothetical protein
MKAQKGSKGKALLFLNLDTRWGLAVNATLRPLYRFKRQGGPQEQSGRLLKISPPPGFELRTVQGVVSRYTD